MIDRELDMRAEVADREFIARDDIALELRRDGQGGAFRREQRIVGAVGARQRAVESVIGDRAEIAADFGIIIAHARSEEHTSELQSLMRISYAVFCLKKKNNENKLLLSILLCLIFSYTIQNIP